MKMIFFFFGFLVITRSEAQSINKIWVDQQATIRYTNFDSAHARYTINTIAVNPEDINRQLSCWSSRSVIKLYIIAADPDNENGLWLIHIIGCADPALKKVTATGVTRPHPKFKGND